jgi:hypothetical protein
VARQYLWVCFKWEGRPAHDIGDNTSKPNMPPTGDGKRRNPNIPVPPIRTREWLNKPPSMRRGGHDSPEAATRWARDEIRTYEPRLPASAQFLSGYDEQVSRALDTLRLGQDWVWYSWFSDGSTQLVLAILRASVGSAAD